MNEELRTDTTLPSPVASTGVGRKTSALQVAQGLGMKDNIGHADAATRRRQFMADFVKH
jgi:hypothetical protein